MPRACSCAPRGSVHRRRRRATPSRGRSSRRAAASATSCDHPPLEDLPFPTLASVQGLCLTAGLELSLACDMIWAAESARFGLVETVVGLTPAMGGTQRMAERAGPARAREFVMTGGLYDAATLERWNVINRVLADGELAASSLRFAQRLAAGPTRAHAATKRMVRAFLEHGVRGADDASATSPRHCSRRGPAERGARRSSPRGPARQRSKAVDFPPSTPLACRVRVGAGRHRKHAAVVRIRRKTAGN